MLLLSINCVAVSLAAFFIAATAGVVLGVTTVFTDTAADSFATRLTAAIATSGRTKMVDYLSRAAGLERATRWGYMADSFPPVMYNQSRQGTTLQEFQRSYMARVVNSDLDITQLGAGFEDGFYMVSAVRNPTAGIMISDLVDPYITNNSRARRRTLTYHNDTLVSDISSFIAYDPRIRDWYKIAKDAGVNGPPQFLDPFIHFLFDFYGCAIVGPIVNASNRTEYLGTTLVGIDLSFVSSFLHGLPSTAGSVTTLVDRQGLLLGMSDLSTLTDVYRVGTNVTGTYASGACAVAPTTKNTVCRRGPSASTNSLLRDAAGARPDLFRPNDTRSNTAVVERFSIAGRGVHYVGVSGVQVPSTLDIGWKLITIVPAADITGDIIEGRNVAIGVGAAVAVFATGVCIAALFWLLRPLRALAQRMLAASTLREDAGSDATSGPSKMAEIRAIEDAFATLNAQLMRARSFLPTTLLAQLDAENETDATDVDAADDEGPEGPIVSEAPSTATASPTGTVDGRHSRRNSRGLFEHSDLSRRSRDGDATPSSHSAGAIAPLATITAAVAATGAIRRRHITVAALNIKGFHSMVAADAAAAAVLGDAYAALVDAVTEGAKEQRGVLDSFHGDRFMITFNAAINCATHAPSAALVAHHLCQRIAPATTCGIATGPAHVGNIGSDRTRRFANVGAVYTTATLLERVAKLVEAPSVILMSRAVATETQHMSDHVFVDAVPLSQTASSSGTRAASAVGAPVAVLCRVHAKGADDEWMYELQKGDTAGGGTVGDGHGAAGGPAGYSRLNALFAAAMDVALGRTAATAPGGIKESDATPPIEASSTPKQAILDALEGDLMPFVLSDSAVVRHAVSTIRRLVNSSTDTGTASHSYWGLYFDRCVVAHGNQSAHRGSVTGTGTLVLH